MGIATSMARCVARAVLGETLFFVISDIPQGTLEVVVLVYLLLDTNWFITIRTSTG